MTNTHELSSTPDPLAVEDALFELGDRAQRLSRGVRYPSGEMPVNPTSGLLNLLCFDGHPVTLSDADQERARLIASAMYLRWHPNGEVNGQ